jgi:hypothetical protein
MSDSHFTAYMLVAEYTTHSTVRFPFFGLLHAGLPKVTGDKHDRAPHVCVSVGSVRGYHHPDRAKSVVRVVQSISFVVPV